MSGPWEKYQQQDMADLHLQRIPESGVLSRAANTVVNAQIQNLRQLHDDWRQDAHAVANPAGDPFKTRFAAQRRMGLDALASTHNIVEVPGGWVLQSNAPVNQEPQQEVSDAIPAVADGGEVRAAPEPDAQPGAAVAADEPGAAVPAAAVDAAPVTPALMEEAKNVPERQEVPEETQAAPGEEGAAQAEAGQPDLGTGWSAFAPESGTLGIPRADMPQIKAEHRGAMTNFLNARGIAHEQVEVPAEILKPAQAEFSSDKVRKAIEHIGGERSILISKDGHILDGHHQWLAALEKGQNVKAILLDAPIRDLIDAVKEFPSATTGHDEVASTTGPEVAQSGQQVGESAAAPTDMGIPSSPVEPSPSAKPLALQARDAKMRAAELA